MEYFRVYETIDSTNKECHRLLASGQNLHGTAILALHQTEGRGQYGRTWISEPGNHLALSVILQPTNMALSELPLLSLKTSIAVVRSLKTLSHDLNPLIKWPNDIYVDGQKIAGILIENSISASKIHHSIIGIGMNVNESEFPAELPNPVSIFILTEKKNEIMSIAENLRNGIMNVLDEPPQKWKSEYDQLIYGLGRMHDFELNGNKVAAIIQGVDLDGKIWLDIEGQKMMSYFSHEIKWMK